MNHNPGLKNIIRYINLILTIFLTNPLPGQQIGSAPVITIVSPASRESFNNKGISVIRAEIVSRTPLKTFRIVINGSITGSETSIKPIEKERNTFVIESLIPLEKGQNIIYVEAKNSIGSATSEKRTITSQLEPFIIWLLPASSNSASESEMLTIKAEIMTDFDLKKVSVNLNGSELDVEKGEYTRLNNETYILEKSIQLKKGKNSINISAINTKGASNSTTRFINWALPIITLVSPSSSDSINNKGITLFSAEIISHTELKTFRIFNNDATTGSESSIKAVRKDSITYIIESLIPLDRGQNIIYAEAKNSIGSSSSEKRIITSQLEPFVTWLMPASVNSNVGSHLLTIKAEIMTDYDLKKVSINLNGAELSGNKGETTRINDNTYSFESTFQLNSDKNIVYISASNAKGVTNSTTRIINFSNGAAPVITLISPSVNDSLNNSGLILINAEIFSNSKLQTVRIFHNKISEIANNLELKDSITYLLKTFVPLQAGINVISVDAKNFIGTASTEKHIIFCRLEPIIKWILPAAVNSTSDSRILNIKAEIKTNLDLIATSINVNGVALPHDKVAFTRLNNDTYILERSLSLNEGGNNIVLNAVNAKGTGYSNKHFINYTPGIISEIKWNMTVDTNAITYKSEFPVSATIKTKSVIKSTNLSINGTELVSEGILNISKKSNEEYLYENKLNLNPGINTFDLFATTESGTINSEKLVIKYVVPALPDLVWKDPVPDQSEVNNPSLDLKMSIKSFAKLENIVVYLNGKALENDSLLNSIKKENEDFVLKSTVLLMQGDNNIYVVADNIAGQAKSEMRNIKYVVPSIPGITAAPEITWLSPSRPYSDIDLYSAEISAKIKTSDKLQSVLVYVNGKGSEEVDKIYSEGSPGEYTLKKTINLQPGENNIYLAVTNYVGTSNSEKRFLTNPAANPPVITWAVPVYDSATVNSDIVVIEACIKSASGLKSAQILVNGVQQASEMTFQEPQSGGCNYRLSKSVVLKEGDNRVFIIAENSAGSNRSDKRLIRFETSQSEKRLALIIGNSNYDNSMVLKNPVNDANLMEGTLKTLGFNVIKRINSTKNDMYEALRDFSKKIPEYNVALFYYAGHGVQVDGLNYLIPTDAMLKEPADCKWEAMRVNDIVEEFEKVPENINIVILDACRNNPFRSWSRGGALGFRIINAVSGTIISYATAENSTATDGLDKNGIFTEELVKQMNIPQSIYQVFNNTRKQVLKRTNNLQRPTESNNLTGDFYFKK